MLRSKIRDRMICSRPPRTILRVITSHTMPRPRDLSVHRRDAHLETVGDAAGAGDKSLGDIAFENLVRGRLEQHKPAVEVFALEL